MRCTARIARHVLLQNRTVLDQFSIFILILISFDFFTVCSLSCLPSCTLGMWYFERLAFIGAWLPLSPSHLRSIPIHVRVPPPLTPPLSHSPSLRLSYFSTLPPQKEGEDSAEIQNMETISVISQLLHVQEETLRLALTTRKSKAGGVDFFVTPYKMEEVSER